MCVCGSRGGGGRWGSRGGGAVCDTGGAGEPSHCVLTTDNPPPPPPATTPTSYSPLLATCYELPTTPLLPTHSYHAPRATRHAPRATPRATGAGEHGHRRGQHRASAPARRRRARRRGRRLGDRAHARRTAAVRRRPTFPLARSPAPAVALAPNLPLAPLPLALPLALPIALPIALALAMALKPDPHPQPDQVRSRRGAAAQDGRRRRARPRRLRGARQSQADARAVIVPMGGSGRLRQDMALRLLR